MDVTQQLLEDAYQRHGGIEAFESISAISLEIVELGGMIPRRQGMGRTWPRPKRVTVEPHRRVCTWHDYPALGECLVFDSGTVVENGTPMANYRQQLLSRQRRRPWSPADAAYFFGYSLVEYLALPFRLRELRCSGGDPSKRRIDVEYPAGSDTHSQGQSFYFDSTGLLRRHDYTAEVLGPWHRGAHFSSDYCESGPIPIARSRSVRARIGRMALPIEVLRARLQIVEVRLFPDPRTADVQEDNQE